MYKARGKARRGRKRGGEAGFGCFSRRGAEFRGGRGGTPVTCKLSAFFFSFFSLKSFFLGWDKKDNGRFES